MEIASLSGAATKAIKDAFGLDAELRDGQLAAVERLLVPGARLLVVQRTGWGKGAVYFLATKFLRERGGGPALIVSPLLALMRNQAQLAAKFGLRSASINSSNSDLWEEVYSQLEGGVIDVLFVSPERLANKEFRSRMARWVSDELGLLVIDEAHCISTWGHDFRIDYQKLIGIVRDIRPEAPILATTATVNERVLDDISALMGGDLSIVRGSLERPELRLSAFHYDEYWVRLAWLATYVPKFRGTGIVYCRTISDAEQVAEWLVSNQILAKPYHSELADDERVLREEEFARNELKCLVATTALGMGYDKLDVEFVVHYDLPDSPLSYYQQVGRAGRGEKAAFGVLFYGSHDGDAIEFVSETAIPAREALEWILEQIGTSGVTQKSLMGGRDFPAKSVSRALEILHAHEAVEVDNGRIRRGPGQIDLDLAEKLKSQRLGDFQMMVAYGKSTECRLVELARLLGEEPGRPCGHCDRCRPRAAVALNERLLARAREFLKSRWYVIKPRNEVPRIGPRAAASSPKELLLGAAKLRDGIAISRYRDHDIGSLIQRAKYGGGSIPDDVVDVCVRAVRASGFGAAWVTSVPTASIQRELISVATRVAERLGVPYLPVLRKSRINKPQKEMATAREQFQNVIGAFDVDGPLAGHGVLIDDIVDSGWTLTIIGAQLVRAGSSEILPIALSTSAPRRQLLPWEPK